MRIPKFLLMFFLPMGVGAVAGDTNFVATFNTLWHSEHASDVLTYVDDYLVTNQNAEALFARGVVAAGLQSWGRGATNYLFQSITAVSENSNYTAQQKSNLTNEIGTVRELIYGLVQDIGEPEDSLPSWNTNTQAEIFGELGDEAPFLDILNHIANPE